MIFVIGNGASRKNVNLDVLKQHGKIIGCNALYRDFTPDHLFANDSIILHEILSSDYSKHHELFLIVPPKILSYLCLLLSKYYQKKLY